MLCVPCAAGSSVTVCQMVERRAMQAMTMALPPDNGASLLTPQHAHATHVSPSGAECLNASARTATGCLAAAEPGAGVGAAMLQSTLPCMESMTSMLPPCLDTATMESSAWQDAGS